MKRYITIIAALVALHSVAVAQNSLGVTVDIQEFEYQSGAVKLNLKFDLDQLKIGANSSAVFTPKIFKGDNSLELQTVVVRSRGGARSYDRAEVLESAKSLESYDKWYGTPYKIVDNYGSTKQNIVQYSQTIPYQSWMVESQLYVECATCGCCTTEDNGSLIPDDNKLLIDIPVITPYTITPQVELVKPEKVAIKRRDVAYSASLIFKVNSTDIDPTTPKNIAELASIDEMMQSVISDSDYTITKINIIGYASPEGSYATNMRLSKGRAAALESLMEQRYKAFKSEMYSVRFGGENWDELVKIVSREQIESKEEILELIANTSIEDGRESKLMSLNGGATYRYLLRNIFPATRLVVVDVEYNVDAYDLDRIAELIDTKPQNLSVEEMYRLSETYSVDDPTFEKIFLTAAEVFPDDEVAQNNALVTEIRRGNIDNLEQIAARIDRETQSAELANSLGVYSMLTGDYQTAKRMLNRAVELGSERAQSNLAQLSTKMENIRQTEEAEAFRLKIYGE